MKNYMTEVLIDPVYKYFGDEFANEILINKPKEIWVDSCGVMERYDDPQIDEAYLKSLFRLIANDSESLTLVDALSLNKLLSNGGSILASSSKPKRAFILFINGAPSNKAR